MTWTLNNVWPTQVTGTDLKSDGNEVTVESIESPSKHWKPRETFTVTVVRPELHQHAPIERSGCRSRVRRPVEA